MFENFEVPSELIPSDPRFGCGPSLVPVSFVESLLKTDKLLLGTSHRKAPVKNLVKGIQEGLTEYFNIPEGYLVTLGNGGATQVFDMIALGLVEKKVTHFTCGEFSGKWAQASGKVPWIDTEITKVDYGNGLNAQNVSSDVICTTLNETSTGVQISSIPEVDADTLLCIDATSGAGQIACDISKTDVFFFSAQKVFASEGGLFVAILSPKAQKRAKKILNDKTRYIPSIMEWSLAMDNALKNQTYNTPSISSLFFLNEQIKEMNKIGLKKVIEMANEKADLVYGWAESKKYLSCYIEEKQFRSRSVATIDVDETIKVDSLLKALEAKSIVLGIDAYRKLGRNQFRISLFHNISLSDLEKLTKVLSLAIESEL